MLVTLPLLSDEELRRARDILRSASWSDGRESAGPQAAPVKNNEQVPAASEASRALQEMILRALDASPRFLSAALPRKLFPPRFNRYGGASNHYGQHVDSAVRFTAEGSRVRTDISCTVFLCAPQEYDGGELVIHDFSSTQKIKLPAGHAVLYPGTSVHEVLPVTRGERLASFFWIESMVRSVEQRRLLLEFDDALTRLRERSGESAETVALAGTYHNLLRMWADT